ncbi:hypothetical protein ACIQC7_27880 [Kitasatospora sp. NPDC088556]|uniref:hypothetical protein n=1 Tax=Kitasatospora sp. NPDC088556 TaxID=3364076 RepID=UPI00382F76DA
MNVTVLLHDLIARTERAVTDVANIAVDTEITFTVDDIVAAVERNLPADYPVPTTGELTRRDMIEQIAADVISGELYER